MISSDASRRVSYIERENIPVCFGEWLKRRRLEVDLTQEQLAKLASCSVFAIRKIEMGERRPSKQLATLLAQALQIPLEDQATFIKVARGELNIVRLGKAASAHSASPSMGSASATGPALVKLPFQPTALIGREAELAALTRLMAEPHCRLVTITGMGGIGKTRLAVEIASQQQALFPGGIYFVALASLNAAEFIVTAIAEVLGLSFSGTGDPKYQLIEQLAARAGRSILLVLDNLEHLLSHPSGPEYKVDAALLISELLRNLPDLKILTTSRERTNLQEEWIFELHGLPVPANNHSGKEKDYSAVALFLQCARQIKVDFQILPNEWPWLVRVCQLVEGTPLAIELAAAWTELLSIEEIAQELNTNLDFLTTRTRNVPERHQSLKAVFSHSWKLLSEDQKGALCRLSVFRGGFHRRAAEKVARASLPVLLSLHSKSLLYRREDGRYDLHALIRQCALEKLENTSYFIETCDQHLDYYVSLGQEAQQGLRSAHLADWLGLIEQEHHNIRTALEWAFSPGAPPERVDQGLCLLTSIDRYWSARGHIREGITWLESGLHASDRATLNRAKALRMAGWLYNHGDDDQTAIAFLQESVRIARMLNDETCQANALDTLGDVAWRFGDFAHAKAYYAESLELLRREGDPRKIGLSLASAGRLHVDFGDCQEASQFLSEGLSFLELTSDLRGRAYCLNALGRVALIQGEVQLAAARFREALQLNNELGYMMDISECLHELAVVGAITGDESSASRLWGASTALQKRIGFTYPVNDPVYLLAPSAWLEMAPSSREWADGEKMSLEQAVAYALEHSG
jgi:predicted ATPase/transcriptional regulator with XRE-family HTH domain